MKLNNDGDGTGGEVRVFWCLMAQGEVSKGCIGVRFITMCAQIGWKGEGKRGVSGDCQ